MVHSGVHVQGSFIVLSLIFFFGNNNRLIHVHNLHSNVLDCYINSTVPQHLTFIQKKFPALQYINLHSVKIISTVRCSCVGNCRQI